MIRSVTVFAGLLFISVVACAGGTSAVETTTVKAPKSAKVATFGGGCFWCMEPPFEKLKGDIEMVRGLMDKVKPVVQDKIKEYKPIIKKDANKMKTQFEKDVLPGLKSMGQQFKDSFEKSGMNSKKFKDSIKK